MFTHYNKQPNIFLPDFWETKEWPDLVDIQKQPCIHIGSECEVITYFRSVCFFSKLNGNGKLILQRNLKHTGIKHVVCPSVLFPETWVYVVVITYSLTLAFYFTSCLGIGTQAGVCANSSALLLKEATPVFGRCKFNSNLLCWGLLLHETFADPQIHWVLWRRSVPWSLICATPQKVCFLKSSPLGNQVSFLTRIPFFV